MTNLLLNPDLIYVAEDDPHRTWCYTTSDQDQEFYTTSLRHQLTRPKHWEIWFEHAEEFRPPWDLANESGWIVPEVKLTEALFDVAGNVIKKVFPERWCGDARGVAFFNTNAISRGGNYQQVGVVPGDEYKLSGWAHGWSSDRHDPLCSDGVGHGPFAMSWADIVSEFADDLKRVDMLQSLSFRVGVDPTGGVNPFSPDVVWSEPYAIYNEYSELPSVTVTAESNVVTVFSWCDNRWRNHHNDRYMTKFSLKAIDEAEVLLPDPPANVEYNYPVVETGSKWHPHGIGEAGAYDILKRMADEGSPLPYCKIVAPEHKDMLAVRNLKTLSPTTKFIVRLMHGTDPNINIEGPDFNGSAMAYMNSLKPIIDEYRDVVEYWELWNEQDPPSHVMMAIFSSECMRIADEWGIKLALMSYSTGVPEMQDWWDIWEYTDFFPLAKAGGHILSLHAYCRSIYPEEWKSHLLRPKQLYDEILIPNNCVIPFIFTEYSITEIGAGGIWDHPEYPTIDSLTTEFAKADTAMSKMYYCLGLSGFSMGEGWSRYDMRTMWPELCDMMLRVSGRENALPPDVAPQPPVNVLPVAPYDKRYNVVEADIPLARRFEIYAFCAETQQTVGPAATDAVSWATELLDAGKSVVMAVWDRKTEDRPAWIVWAYNIDPRIEVEFMGTSPPDVIWDRDVTEGLPYRTDIPEFPEGWSLRSLDEIDALTFHHTYGAVDPADMYWYVYEKDGVGRPSQPYTLWIMGDGEIVKANELEWACYHDHTGYPNYHLSVGVAGRLDTAPPTQAQLESMVKVANWAVDHPEMQILDSDITGHMDWTTTECPGWSSQGSGYWKNTFLNMWHPVDSQVTGVHAAPILSAPVNGMDNEISRLRSLREIPNWYKLLYNGDHGMLTWIRLLKDSGIEPVVRLYEPGSHLPGRNPRVVLHAAEVVAAGGEFIEGMNEPNIEMANADWHNLSQANTLAQSWWDDAMYIISVGGKAAFPAMAPTDRGAVNQTVSGVEWFNRIMDWAVDYHYEEFKSYVEQGKIWLAVHVSPFNKLFDFDPEQDGYVDDFCILYYEYLQDQFYEELGSIPVTISTEGGAYSPSHMHDLTFPVVNGFVVDGDGLPIYNDAGWGDYTWDLDSFLRKHNTLDGMCSWTFSDQGVADQRWVGSGWYDKNGAPRSPAL